jgi:hypothetical protein
MLKAVQALAVGFVCIMLAEDHPLLAIALFVLITWLPKESVHV